MRARVRRGEVFWIVAAHISIVYEYVETRHTEEMLLLKSRKNPQHHAS